MRQWFPWVCESWEAKQEMARHGELRNNKRHRRALKGEGGSEGQSLPLGDLVRAAPMGGCPVGRLSYVEAVP